MLTGKLAALAAFALLSMTMTAALSAEAPSMPLVSNKPVKVGATEANGLIFSSPSAVEETGPDGPAKNVSLLRSEDKRVEMGLYEAGPIEVDVESYPADEFMYFIAGSVTLTSADKTILIVKAGEGVAVPRGWKGHWSTKGYKKYYVAYTAP